MQELKKSDFCMGQTVYLLKIWNSYDLQNLDRDIHPVTVTAIGRKYLTVDFFGPVQFDITDNFRHHSVYGPEWELHLSKEGARKSVETSEMYKIVRNVADKYLRDLSLEDLKEVYGIINKYRKDENND